MTLTTVTLAVVLSEPGTRKLWGTDIERALRNMAPICSEVMIPLVTGLISEPDWATMLLAMTILILPDLRVRISLVMGTEPARTATLSDRRDLSRRRVKIQVAALLLTVTMLLGVIHRTVLRVTVFPRLTLTRDPIENRGLSSKASAAIVLLRMCPSSFPLVSLVTLWWTATVDIFSLPDSVATCIVLCACNSSKTRRRCRDETTRIPLYIKVYKLNWSECPGDNPLKTLGNLGAYPCKLCKTVYRVN